MILKVIIDIYRFIYIVLSYFFIQRQIFIKEMDIQGFDLDEFFIFDKQMHGNQVNTVLEEVHTPKTSQQMLSQVNQIQLQIDLSLDKNQFLYQEQSRQISNMSKETTQKSSKLCKPRKKRIEINLIIIEQMNLAFQKLEQKDSSSFKNQLTLKKIAQKLNLSQVTISRKYKQFKKYREVVRGPKLEAKNIRSYKKTQEMYQIVEECLKAKTFYSASQLGQYIKKKYGKQYSRFQIRSCLKKFNQEDGLMMDRANQAKKNKLVYEKYHNYIENHTAILFFGKIDYYAKDLTYFNISLICGEEGLQFLITIQGEKSEASIFDNLLQAYLQEYGNIQNWVIVTGVHQLHKRNEDNQKSKINSILQLVVQKNGNIFCLPSEYEKQNLAKSILIKNTLDLYKPERYFVDYITTKLQNEKQYYSRSDFLRFTSQADQKQIHKENMKQGKFKQN